MPPPVKELPPRWRTWNQTTTPTYTPQCIPTPRPMTTPSLPVHLAIYVCNGCVCVRCGVAVLFYVHVLWTRKLHSEVGLGRGRITPRWCISNHAPSGCLTAHSHSMQHQSTPEHAPRSQIGVLGTGNTGTRNAEHREHTHRGYALGAWLWFLTLLWFLV